MPEDPEFAALWDHYTKRSRRDPEQESCPISREFSKKLEETIFGPLGEAPSAGQIAQAKYFLQEEWHAWRRAIPARRFQAIDPGDHRDCLQETYFRAYDRLQVLELTRRPPNLITEYDRLTNPPINTPPAPPAPPPPQIAGIFLGEKDPLPTEE